MQRSLVILFDLDGTLIDSTDAIVDTFYYVFKQYNFDFGGGDEDIINLIGYPLEVMFEKLGVSSHLTQEYTTTYKERYRLISKDSTTLIDGAKQSLDEAKKVARLAVVTTKTARYAKPLLAHLGILDYFEEIIGAEDVTNCKPFAEPINKVLELMNISKTNNEIWMIGDTRLDLIASNRAMIRSIGVSTGYEKSEILEQYTPYVVENSLKAVRLIIKISRL